MKRTMRSDVIHTMNGSPPLHVSNLEFDVHSRYPSVAVETWTGIVSFCSKGFRSADIGDVFGRRYCWVQAVFFTIFRKTFYYYYQTRSRFIWGNIFNRQMRNVRRKSNNNNGYERTLKIRDGETSIALSPK